jgi:hypothetical protein
MLLHDNNNVHAVDRKLGNNPDHNIYNGKAKGCTEINV